jgi:hypothetical protein
MSVRLCVQTLLGVLVTIALSVVTIHAVRANTPAPTAVTAVTYSPLTAAQDGTVTGLAPGGAAQDVNYTIFNPKTTALYAIAVTISIAGLKYIAAAGAGVGATWLNHPADGPAPGCTAEDFTIVRPDALGQRLAAGATSFTRKTVRKSGTIAMKNTDRNQDDCKATAMTLAISVA